MGYHCDAYRLLDATDVHEVIHWAVKTARPEQAFNPYVRTPSGRSPGLFQPSGYIRQIGTERTVRRDPRFDSMLLISS